MAKISEVKGITVKKKKIPVIPLDDEPENQFLSKAKFLEKREKQKAAKSAAKEAYDKVLQGEEEQGEGVDPLIQLRKNLAKAESNLAKKPENRAYQKKVADASALLEEAEA